MMTALDFQVIRFDVFRGGEAAYNCSAIRVEQQWLAGTQHLDNNPPGDDDDSDSETLFPHDLGDPVGRRLTRTGSAPHIAA